MGQRLCPVHALANKCHSKKKLLDDIEADHSRFNIKERLASFPPALILQGEEDQPGLVEGRT